MDSSLHDLVALPTALAAIATAVYTAWLFAQAKARDLWQSALLPPHLLVQAFAAGSAALLVAAWFFQPGAVGALSTVLAVSSLLHLLFVAGEVTLPHGTAHAKFAIREMTTGRYRAYFWLGLLGAAAGCATSWGGFEASLPLAILSLVGLGLYEHSYVQAGQAVPLA